MNGHSTFSIGRRGSGISLMAFLCLAGTSACGSHPSENPKESSKPVVHAMDGQALERSLQGSWTSACDPQGMPMSESLSFANGTFVRETAIYEEHCSREKSRSTSRGRYTVGEQVRNLKELVFDGTFSLKDAVGKTAWKLDFIIDEYVVRDPRLADVPAAEMERFRAACPGMTMDEDGHLMRIPTSNCTSEGYRSHSFDIFSQEGDELRLGVFMGGDLNSFDGREGGSEEFRNNVLASKAFLRVE